MAKTATIQTRVDPAVKQKAQIILNKLNISMSEAISMYLSQIALHNGIPFEIKLPNDVTEKVMEDSEHGENLHQTDSIDDLFQELDRDTPMEAITYTAVRQNLAQTMDKVCNDRSPVIVTRKSSNSVVIMSLEDFESLEETAYLLRSPQNAKRLLESIAQLENGKG